MLELLLFVLRENLANAREEAVVVISEVEGVSVLFLDILLTEALNIVCRLRSNDRRYSKLQLRE